MAGIGVKLNKIYRRRTISTSLYGVSLSVIYTIAPMLLVMASLLVMYRLLGFDSVQYYDRELFSCTVLYVFIFSLLFSTSFNSVLSKYISDRVFEKAYEDIPPCMLVGITVKLGISSLIAVPFYLHELRVGKVPVYYVFTSYMMYVALTLAFSEMLYGVVLKKFTYISSVFGAGSLTAIVLSWLLRHVAGFSITYSMLLALTVDFWLVAALLFFSARHRFLESSDNYKPVFAYFGRYWRLLLGDFFYIFGLFAHNFVFWTQPDRLEIAKTYICNQPYDMASCVAMFTCLSSTVIFISKVEMHFFKRYKEFNASIVGGSIHQIDRAKQLMFRSLAKEIRDLVYVQFSISVVLFLLVELLYPYMGLGGKTMDIYPMLAVGYFVSFLMYANILFQQYFTDYTGSMLTGLIYAALSALGAWCSSSLPQVWYGLGFTLAALSAYVFSYLRLRRMERELYVHVYCEGTILQYKTGERPDPEVFHKTSEDEKNRLTVQQNLNG